MPCMISEHKSHDYGHDIMFHISVDKPGHAPSQQGKDWPRCPTLKSEFFKFLKWNRLPAEIITQLGAAVVQSDASCHFRRVPRRSRNYAALPASCEGRRGRSTNGDLLPPPPSAVPAPSPSSSQSDISGAGRRDGVAAGPGAPPAPPGAAPGAGEDAGEAAATLRPQRPNHPWVLRVK
jgi:hypothetical protein